MQKVTQWQFNKLKAKVNNLERENKRLARLLRARHNWQNNTYLTVIRKNTSTKN